MTNTKIKHLDGRFYPISGKYRPSLLHFPEIASEFFQKRERMSRGKALTLQLYDKSVQDKPVADMVLPVSA